MASFISEKFFSPLPGRAIIIKSAPGFMFFSSALIIPDNLLFNLFLTTAFLETFELTTNPNLFKPKLFFTILKIKRLFLKLFEFLKIISKSFFFFILFIFGKLILHAKFCPALSPSFLKNLPACFCFFSSQKAVGVSPFFLFWIICKAHVVCFFN